jgi:TPP-dependent pyruvate/acetoin dehydrogenase alpha subunit
MRSSEYGASRSVIGMGHATILGEDLKISGIRDHVDAIARDAPSGDAFDDPWGKADAPISGAVAAPLKQRHHRKNKRILDRAHGSGKLRP